jgi:ABC-type nitrate/sulfonate/bicarbonate transport system permease component
MGMSWSSIVAEMIVAVSGLGYVILQAGVYLRTDLIFAGIVTIAVLGLILDSILRVIQRRLDPSGQLT